MTLLDFNDGIPVGSQVSLGTLDRGVVSGVAIPTPVVGPDLTVNSILVGGAGSGRLIDLNVANLFDGMVFYVRTVKDFFRWDATDTRANNNKTIVAVTSNGANPGRFERMGIPAPEWMAQLTWYIDPITGVAGNDENSGIDAAHPLQSDAERQRRMGPNPLWNGGIVPGVAGTAPYHLFYLNDLDPTDPVVVAGRAPSIATIFLHGSATPGQGQSVLFTIPGDAVVTAINRATNTPITLASASIPVSWTASGLINKRLRRTNGTGIKGWATKDLAAKTARTTVFLPTNTYTVPFSSGNTVTAPTNGDTFVVEQLTKIPSFTISITGADDLSVNTGGNFLVVESLDLGSSAFLVTSLNNRGTIVFDGCDLNMLGSRGDGSISYVECRFRATSGSWRPAGDNNNFSAGYSSSAAIFNFGVARTFQFIRDFGFQGATWTFNGSGGTLAGLGDFCVFDSPGSALILNCSACQVVLGSSGAFYGSGNTGWSIDFVLPGQVVGFATGNTFPIVSASGDIRIVTRTTEHAFDDAAGTYTAARALTFALLGTAVGGGGFGNNLLSPVKACGMIATS